MMCFKIRRSVPAVGTGILGRVSYDVFWKLGVLYLVGTGILGCVSYDVF